MGNQQDSENQQNNDVTDLTNQQKQKNNQNQSEIEEEFLGKIIDVERRNRWMRCLKEFRIHTMEDLIQSYGLNKTSKVGRRCNEAELIILNDYFLKKQKVFKVDLKQVHIQTIDYLQQEQLTDVIVVNSMPLIIRNILIVGITGQGKTTFINSFVTYLKGFNAADSYKKVQERYEVARVNRQDANSDTQQVSSYQIIHNNYLFNLIDTPGLADTQGFEADQKRVNQISQYIKDNLKQKKQLLHGILIVSQSSTQYEVQDGMRTLLQMAMLNILKLFDKNMCGFTTHILSFSDFTTTNIANFESPNSIFYSLTVEQSTKNFNESNNQISSSNPFDSTQNQQEQKAFQQYIQFQNSVFQAKEIGFIEKIQIKRNIENYNQLCKKIEASPGFSLDETCEVIKTRDEIKIEIKHVLSKLASLTNAKKRIQDCIKKIDIFINRALDSENYEYIDFITTCQKIYQQKEGVYFTNCQHCSRSCCLECAVTNIEHCNQMCEVKNGNEKTKICNKCQCSIDKHINERYKWVFRTDEVKQINETLKNEHDQAISLQQEAERRKEQQESLLKEVKEEIQQIILHLKECLESLLTSALYNFDISDHEAVEYIEKCYPDFKDALSEFHTHQEFRVNPKIRKQQKDKIMHSMTFLGIKTIQFKDK